MADETRHLREFGKFRLDAKKRVLWFEDEPVNLQLKEIELLCVLTENGGEVVTKEDLLNRVWADSFVAEGNLSRHIHQIRKIFKQYGAESDLIQTVPRRGYRFAGEVREERDDETIIERRAVTRLLVEELENSAEPNVKIVKPVKTGTKTFRLMLTVGAFVLLAVSSFYFYRQIPKPAAAQPIKSIVVLPLKSLSDDDRDKALSLGFADALITSLGNLDEIKVISTNAASRHLDDTRSPVEIGKTLNVDAVLEGAFQHADGKLRVTLRLFRTDDGRQLWSGSFDEKETEIFRLQDSMALQTAQVLALNLKPDGAPNRQTDNLEAYNLFLKAEYLFRLRVNRENSIAFYKQAIEKDPNFARAWAGLAAMQAMGTEIEEAEKTLDKALALDPNLAEAHATRGFLRMFHYWDWTQAEQSLNRAVELDPNSAQAHHWRGVFLSFHGRLDEAKSEMLRALELDPLNLNFMCDLGQLYYFSHDFETAEEYCLKALAIDPNYGWAHQYLGYIYLEQGKDEDALKHYVAAELHDYHDEERVKWTRWYEDNFRRGGWAQVHRANIELILQHFAAKKLSRVDFANNYNTVAVNYLWLGDKDKAIEYLNRALAAKTKYEIMNFTFPYLKVDPAWDTLRDDPRFREILQKLNLN